MKKLFGLVALAIGVFLLARCTSHSGESKTPPPAPAQEVPIVLVGKTLFIDYGTMKAEVRYQTDSLYWRTMTPDGVATGSDREVPSYEALGDGRFFVTWQEADGTAVAQVIDLKENKVLANILSPIKSQDEERRPLTLVGAAAVTSEEPAR